MTTPATMQTLIQLIPCLCFNLWNTNKELITKLAPLQFGVITWHGFCLLITIHVQPGRGDVIRGHTLGDVPADDLVPNGAKPSVGTMRVIFFFEVVSVVWNKIDMLCVKYRMDWTTEMVVMDELSFARCEVKPSIGWISSVDLSPRSAVYMRQWTGSALVQIMACRLVGAKPLSEPTLVYCLLGPWEQISVKF